ncbi:MAG: histidine--tRNA ligase [Thermoanaerobacteraceae bacterium]|nr:histidine--tRNA ligase [Thermoanaerobacteraceae bacterium]
MKPVTLSGFRDYLPREASIRQEIIRVFKETCDLFGFAPLETPAVERWDILAKDRESLDVIIYSVQGSKERNEDTKKGLRFDLTVPLSRVVAANPKLPKLFKRYQIGPVWRGERPQAGRYREFVQCDADIVGSKSVISDAELVSLMGNVFKKLNITEYQIKINNRKILNGLPKLAGFSEEFLPEVLRILDKLEKEGREKIESSLRNKPFLSEASVGRIMKLLSIPPGKAEWLSEMRRLFVGINVSEEGIAELEKMGKWLENFDMPSQNWIFDITVVRGLAYYTGPIFETTLSDCPEMGSICSGGRYDGLASRFGANKPGTGISLGLDRFYAALEKINALPKVNEGPQTVIISADDISFIEAGRIATTLRKNQIKTSLYPEPKLREGLAYANAINATYAIILGEKEVAEKTVQIKFLKKGEQKTIRRDELLSVFSEQEVF